MKKIFLILGVAGFLFGSFKAFEFYKSEKQRMQSNYENLLKERNEAFKAIDSAFKVSQTKFVEYTFRKDKELLEYLNTSKNQLKGLRSMLDESNIKIKQLTEITSTALKARDTIKSIVNIDSLAQKINSQVDFSVPILDITPCFEIKGSFDYVDKQGKINITSRKFTDTITTVDYWQRKKHRWVFGFRTGLFGKKEIHRKEESKCSGNIKTIVIHKK